MSRSRRGAPRRFRCWSARWRRSRSARPTTPRSSRPARRAAAGGGGGRGPGRRAARARRARPPARLAGRRRAELTGEGTARRRRLRDGAGGVRARARQPWDRRASARRCRRGGRRADRGAARAGRPDPDAAAVAGGARRMPCLIVRLAVIVVAEGAGAGRRRAVGGAVVTDADRHARARQADLLRHRLRLRHRPADSRRHPGSAFSAPTARARRRSCACCSGSSMRPPGRSNCSASDAAAGGKGAAPRRGAGRGPRGLGGPVRTDETVPHQCRRSGPGEGRRRRVDEALERVGLGGIDGRPARALPWACASARLRGRAAARPGILLLDDR